MAGWRGRIGGDGAGTRTALAAIAGSIGWVLNNRYGYGGGEVSYKGDPSVATAEIGHAFREMMAEDCLEIVEGVVTGRMAPELVRSIASDYAVIQPGFVAKIALAAAVLLAVLVL
jgi:hypothetical protein